MSMTENKTLHILFASRLVYEKWADILIEAIEKSFWGDFGRDIIWYICSEWPYMREIIALAQKHPEKVIYHGIVDQASLASLYRGVDFLFMPSRFLETFGLTALESLACGTPVIWFSKGWLIPFISPVYSLDPNLPIKSFSKIIQNIAADRTKRIDVTSYSQDTWKKSLRNYFLGAWSVMILHDYHEKIWWAEYYVSQVESSLLQMGYAVSRYGYTGTTNPWKQRWMFIFSIFAFWRGIWIAHLLAKEKPEFIWMHSIQRYIWFWWVRAAMQYAKNVGAKVYLSHHDVWLIAAFPQDITEEHDIPCDFSLQAFLRGLPWAKKIPAIGKYYFIQLLRSSFPESIEHIIFAPFLEKHIQAHFPWNKIHIFPHSFDEEIFYPKI